MVFWFINDIWKKSSTIFCYLIFMWTFFFPRFFLCDEMFVNSVFIIQNSAYSDGNWDSARASNNARTFFIDSSSGFLSSTFLFFIFFWEQFINQVTHLRKCCCLVECPSQFNSTLLILPSCCLHAEFVSSPEILFLMLRPAEWRFIMLGSSSSKHF